MDNQNKVTLIGHYGGDYTHANSAWQSTNLELNLELSDDINQRGIDIYEATVATKKRPMPELLKMLAEANHETPFEKSTLHFQLTGDIASHIHVIKHRVAVSVNSESKRYKELSDKWYIPQDWKDLKVNPDQFLDNVDNYNYDSLFIDYPPSWSNILDDYVSLGHQIYHQAIEQLTPKLGRKRAKESAGYFLPYAKQLDFDAMFNFRSFVHFQKLRNSEHAQKEIREIAQQMLEQVRQIPGEPFKYSLEAFGY